MKYTYATLILLISLLSCKKEEPVQPANLIGNWKTIPNGQPYLRWTFDQNNAYQTWTKVDDCQPVTPPKSTIINKYTVRNDTLFFEWRDQFAQSFEVYYPIKTLTKNRLVISKAIANEQDSIFEKCQ